MYNPKNLEIKEEPYNRRSVSKPVTVLGCIWQYRIGASLLCAKMQCFVIKYTPGVMFCVRHACSEPSFSLLHCSPAVLRNQEALPLRNTAHPSSVEQREARTSTGATMRLRNTDTWATRNLYRPAVKAWLTAQSRLIKFFNTVSPWTFPQFRHDSCSSAESWCTVDSFDICALRVFRVNCFIAMVSSFHNRQH